MKTRLILTAWMAAVYLTLGFAFPPPAQAQEPPQVMSYSPIARDYDLDSTTYVYVTAGGLETNLSQAWTEVGKFGNQRVTTSGSSTTVTPVTASSGPFTSVAVGDILRFSVSGQTVYRWVTARASANSITINAAIQLDDITTGHNFFYRHPTIASSGGWIAVRDWAQVRFQIDIAQIDTTTGIDVKIECRDEDPNVSPVIVGPGSSGTATYTTAGVHAQVINEKYSYCRVGMKMTSTDDGADTTTHTEKINIDMVAWK